MSFKIINDRAFVVSEFYSIFEIFPLPESSF